MWFNNLHFTVMVVIKITIVEVAINPQVFTATTADWVSLVYSTSLIVPPVAM